MQIMASDHSCKQSGNEREGEVKLNTRHKEQLTIKIKQEIKCDNYKGTKG